MNLEIPRTLALAGGIEIDLIANGNSFQGFGEIRHNGLPLRSAEVPLAVDISTPYGVIYTHFTLENIVSDPQETRVKLLAHGQQRLRTRLEDDFESDFIMPSVQVGKSVTAGLTWILKPCQRTIDGEVFTGFSYALEFVSKHHKIYHLDIRSTFELGGSIEGVTVLHQGQVAPPVFEASREATFTNSCLKSIGDPCVGKASVRNHSMQMNSRNGNMQCFDYQYSPRGVLIGMWPRGEYRRNLTQKNPDETVLHIIDEEHVPYALEARTCGKEILFAPITDPLRARDMWKSVKDLNQNILLRQWGIKPITIHTEGMNNDSWAGGQPGSKCWFGGRVVPSTEILRVLADEWFPQLKEKGVELVGCSTYQESDFSEMLDRSKRQDGLHSELFVSSDCNPWRYYPSKYWGGMDAWRYYADRAHDMGLLVGTWVGNNISSNAPAYREHPEWFNRGRTGRPNMGGYTSTLGGTIDWNSPARQWVVDSLKRWRDEGGLDYIFIDSWGNLSQLPIHHDKDFSNNLDGVARLVAELQEAGFKYISNEGMGQLCVPRFGLGAHQTLAEGQNSLYWWIGNEDMADGTNPLILYPDGESEESVHKMLFQFMANYCLMEIQAWEGELPADVREDLKREKYAFGSTGVQLPACYNPLQRLWPKVRDYMFQQKRETLPDGRGVLWTGGMRSVLFAYKAFSYATDGQPVEQIYPVQKPCSGQFQTNSLGVYLMG